MTKRLRMRSRRGFALFLALLLCLGMLQTIAYATECEHEWELKDLITAPDCTNDGEGTFVCTKCGTTENQTVRKLGHSYEGIGWTDGDEQGQSHTSDCHSKHHYRVCGRCNEGIQFELHEDNWETTKDPTETEPGLQRNLCMKCGHSEERSIYITKYTVTYTWEGLPGEAGMTPPGKAEYARGTQVTVDNRANGDEISVNGRTYVFSGWSTDDATITDGKFNMPEKDVKLTGTWTEKVTLTYDGNHSTGGTAPAAQTVKKGETVTVSDKGALVREGYTFLGWSTDPDAAEADAGWSAGTSKALDADTTLYAVWQKNVEDPVYTLTYDGNGSTGGSVPPQQTANKENAYTVTVSEKGDLVRSGHTFLGWSTDRSATEADADWSAGTSKVLHANMTLYAVWQKASTPRPDPDPEPERPKPEDPKPETPKPEPPKPEAPKPEEPQPETPQPETPTPDPLPERPVDPDTGMVPYDPAVILEDLVPLAAPHLNVTDHFAYIIGYPDGMVKPTGNITRAEAATIFLRLMLDEYRQENWATENAFSDVDAGAWYYNAVSTCAKAGIIQGYPDGTFRPNANITRAEFAAIAARFVSEDVPGYDYFTDMNGHWAQKDVARAVMAGWIRGDGRIFRPQDQMSRAETATLVNRMINRFPDKEHLLAEMIRWPDNLESDWFYEDVQEATNSHDYEGGALTLAEVWTGLLDNRDWAALEVQWAAAGDAPGGEVAPELQNGAQ